MSKDFPSNNTDPNVLQSSEEARENEVVGEETKVKEMEGDGPEGEVLRGKETRDEPEGEGTRGKGTEGSETREPGGEEVAAGQGRGTEERRHTICCSYRLLIAIGAFVSVYNITYIRLSVVIAMLCMTKPLNHNGSVIEPDCPPLEVEESKGFAYEFDWPNNLKGFLLSGAFYGFLIGPFISGFLSFKFGGKIILLIGHVLSGVTYAALPELTRIHHYFFFILRIITGLFAGLIFPATFDVLIHWVVPEERQILVGGALIGVPLCSVTMYPLNGLLCSGLGWVWIFYFTTIWLMVSSIFLYFFMYNAPQQCPYVSDHERTYVESKTPYRAKGLKVPWRQILKCVPIYAYLVTHFCINYCFLTIITALPLYMHQVHHFNLKSNSLLSSSPYLASLLCRIALNFAFDPTRKKLNLSTNLFRKINVIIGLLIPVISLVAISQLSCRYRYAALSCFIIFSAALEISITGGYLLSLLDMCPSYNNILSGFSNALANAAGLIAVTIIGVLTPNGTRQEWNNVFYICIALLIIAGFAYVLLGTNQLQPWGLVVAKKSEEEKLARISHLSLAP